MKKNSQTSSIYHTFDEWQRLGYGVLKGSKSKSINEEFVATFSEDQVDKLTPKRGYGYNNHDNWIMEDCWADIGDIY